ncbi:MAG: YkgJ family cysteine cluster protein [SAR324 cluster bacterium]|nr:YkgJ family cysteine cluster protein [SAR324 cluster bacterium]
MEKNQNINKRERGEFDLKPIADDATFRFSCHPGISCFNECCHEIDVVLTPFDVLRIKKRLGVRSDEFLAKYTLLQSYKDSDIPLLKLAVADEKSRKCIFLGEAGCTIYDSRPIVCRNYPTGLASQDPTSGQSAQPYFIIEEDMCKGHFEGQNWSISEWKASQSAIELDELNKPWLEMIPRLKSLKLKNDEDQKMNIFVMVSFDQDTFRSFVFESTFLERFEVSQERADQLKQDENELLKFGFQWLEFVLFGEGPIRPKK